jgi:hypothetical protein
MEPEGLALSSFRNNRHGPQSNLVISISGVFAYEIEHRGHKAVYP